MQTYFTHDNGGRPFKVEVNDKHVKVFNTDGLVYENECDQVFVGKSPLCPMTEYSGGHGPDFDGNTLLLKPEADENVYLFVASVITSFVPQAPIVEFVSHVGNNDVPYPYAIDSQGNYYLLIENVWLEQSEDQEDPYTDYYHRSTMTRNRAFVGASSPTNPFIFHGKTIKELYLGGDRYTLAYHSFPSEDYTRLVQDLGEARLGYDDGSQEVLTKEAYVELMESYGVQEGFHPLEMTTVVEYEEESF